MPLAPTRERQLGSTSKGWLWLQVNLEGLEEILIVVSLRLLKKFRRSVICIKMAENIGTIRYHAT